MPYRALLWTIVTVGLALLAVGMWVRAVGPLLEENTKHETRNAKLVERKSAEGAARPVATRVAPAGSEQGLRRLVHGTLLRSFVLICMLLVVGLAGAFREWVRFRTLGAGRVRKGVEKTKYVDAWKIAGERMGAEGDGGRGDDKGTG
jgi:hypothetical protein